MDFEEQLEFLSELLGDPNTSTDDMFPLARRKKAINRGEIQFAIDSLAIREYATGTVENNTIILPINWVETFCLVVDNKVISGKRQMPLKDWGRFYQGDSDDPTSYTWEISGARTITFMDGSGFDGKTYKLWYFKKQTVAMDALTDESLLYDEFREGPVYWAAARMFQQIGKTELSNRYLQQYAVYLSKAHNQIGKEYVNHESANPDLDIGGYNSTTDHQGQCNRGLY